MEKTNARYPFEVPELVDLIVMDVSFISIGMVIPEVIRHLKQGHYIVSLVKPQFESQRDQVGRGGVIKDPKVHASVLGKIVNWAVGQDIRVRNICRSPIQGDSGNREFFILLEKP
jgi:23S rRNA (cytidine1920-2'-O)/16S rRNA (cytidine1409-2'-O)-methyltransferase